MTQKFNDRKYKLGEPLATMLKDFCAANYNAPALAVIREALRDHIEQRLENPDMKRRYDRARKRRLGLDETVVKMVRKDE